MQIGVESSRAVDNKRLFVVDDDEITRAALQFMLHDENETHELADVEKALEMSVQLQPDMVLLGIGAVRRDGLSVLALLKSRIPGVKLLLVADSADDPLVAQCTENGVDDVLVKPITVEETRRRVDRLLGRTSRISIPIHSL